MHDAQDMPLPLAQLPQQYSRLRLAGYRLRQAVDWWLQVRLQRPLTWMLVLLGLSLRRVGLRRRGLDLILKGRRLGRNALADRAIRAILRNDRGIEGDLIALLADSANAPVSKCLGRILVVKSPRLIDGEVVEKGAIILKFTETFARVYIQLDARRLAKYFQVILEPSWVGYSLPEILVWTRVAPEKIVVMAPYAPDYELIESLNSNLVPIRLGPADWVNPSRFHKWHDLDKKYDAVYVANYNPKKRVDRFLRAVVRVSHRRPSYRAAILCAQFGKDAASQALDDVIVWAKSRASIDVFAGVSQAQLNDLFNQSKVNVLLSSREGMNKGLAEGLFAGTPALLLAESACGNHRHINESTGRVVHDATLERALEWFSESYDSFKPEEWMSMNASPRVSSKRLSETLKNIELAAGREWTVDLVPKANGPEMQYVDGEAEELVSIRNGLLLNFAHGGRNVA